MKSAKTKNLDRILGAEEEILPSSGFAASVMERVRHEAAVPEPLPIPWRRALPGIIIVAFALVWCVVKLIQAGLADAGTTIIVPLHSNGPIASSLANACWTAVALGVSLLSWLFARRLIGRGDLV